MRLATARDEIDPLRDPRVQGPDDPILTLIVLSRVITRLGDSDDVGVSEIESLFAADLAYLQDFYGVVNFGSDAEIAELLGEQERVLAELAAVNGLADAAAEEAEAVSAGSRNRRRAIEEVPRGDP